MVAAFLELATNVNDWWRLPLKLRQRWWTETDFGNREPSEDLKAAIRLVLHPKESDMAKNQLEPTAEQEKAMQKLAEERKRRQEQLKKAEETQETQKDK